MRHVFAFIVALLMITAVPTIALATDVFVTTDSTAVKVGDTVTLTVIVTDDHIGVASGSFTYDPALLTYDSSDGGASDGYINMVSAQEGGSSSLSVVIKLTAKAEGTAAVNVSIDNILSYDEQPLEKAEGQVSITIAAADAPPQTSDGEESDPPVDLSQTGVAAQNVTGTEAQMYVWRDLSSLTLPSGFADRQVTYAGEQVGAAAIPDSDEMILLYLSEKAGENAGYYIYNEQNSTLNPYITITSKAASFSIIPDQTVTAPEGFEETTLEWDDQSLPAWKTAESGDTVYLVYARNSKGEKGFYLFNAEDESVQRYAAVPNQGAAPPTSSPAGSATGSATSEKPVVDQTAQIDDPLGVTIDRTLFIVLCIAAALILAAAAVFATLYMRRPRSNHRRATRMKERLEEKQAPVSPTVQAKEKAPSARRTPSPRKTKVRVRRRDDD